MYVRNVIGTPWEFGQWLPRLGFDDPGDGGSGGSSGGSGGSADDGEGAGKGSESGEGSGGDGQSGASGEETVSKADYDALMRRMQAADKAKSDAEAKVKAVEDKDKDAVTKATERAEEAEKSVQTLTAENKSLRLQIAILTDKDNGADRWQDPADVIAALQGDDRISISDTGSVSGVSDALKDLAKRKPYWLKANAGSAGGPSGDGAAGRTGSGGKGKPTQAERESALRSKYPALRGKQRR